MTGSCSLQVIASYICIVPLMYILYLCIYKIFLQKERIDPKTGLIEKPEPKLWPSIGAIVSLLLIIVCIYLIMSNRPAKIESTPVNVNSNRQLYSEYI